MTHAGSPVLRRLARKPVALAAFSWLVLITVACFAAPLLVAADPLTQNLGEIKQLPSLAHPLGTDQLGRDVLSRLLYGGVGALVGATQAAITATLLGVVLGITSGFLRGAYDTAVSGLLDVLLAIPTIVILLSVLALFEQDMTGAMIALGVLGSAGIARVVRSATLSVRDDLYIDAARVNGLSTWLILPRHVLPRVSAPIVVQVALFIAAALIAQTGISFLGLGVRPPQPSWGGLIADASSAIGDFPWLLVPSGGVVALTILAIGLAGDGIRDAITEVWAGTTVGRSADHRRMVLPSATTDGTGRLDGDAALSVRGLIVADNTGHELLHDVSYDLRPGEILGVVGESGSGKTTTALASIGLLPPGLRVIDGRMLVFGKPYDLLDRRSMRELWGREIGLISQEPMIALDPCFTVDSAIGEVVRRRDRVSRRAAHDRVIELLEMVRIPDPVAVAKKYPHQLSGGMAQRVSIARALAARPSVLVADEPTTALDVTVQAEILDVIRVISQSQGMAVLFVTHDWGVVADICDRVMVLLRGDVIETGDVEQIFHAPRADYTKALLEANPHAAEPGERLPTLTDLLRTVKL